MIRELRDQILRLQGYEVKSTTPTDDIAGFFREQSYTLVLIDVEAPARVSFAEQLCSVIKSTRPGQSIAFVCNHRVSIESDCPDEIIRSEFNPEALVKGVQHLIQNNPRSVVAG